MSSAVMYADCPPPVQTHRARIRVEPLAQGDVDTVQQVFAGLGPRSRELRFLTAKPRLTSADLRSLGDVDGRDRVALVARHEGSAIGIARFVRDTEDPGSADVAVAVVDAWQDRWVGTRLAHALLDRALELGISRFSMAIAHENEAAIRLMHRISDDVTRVGWDSGTVEFEVSVRPERGRGRAVLKGCAT
jgi:RimJ/RimL family protein N-acetyltransferase